MDRDRLVQALEALLFVADEPISAGSLAQAVEADRRSVEEALEQLSRSYEERAAGIVLRSRWGERRAVEATLSAALPAPGDTLPV